jgi:hypothetical protein
MKRQPNEIPVGEVPAPNLASESGSAIRPGQDGQEGLQDHASMSDKERFDLSSLAHLSDEELGLKTPGAARLYGIPSIERILGDEDV